LEIIDASWTEEGLQKRIRVLWRWTLFILINDDCFLNTHCHKKKTKAQN